MNVLILGTNGMLGSACFALFEEDKDCQVYGVLRDPTWMQQFPENSRAHLESGVDLLDQQAVENVIARTQPDIVINCAGLTKHVPGAEDPLQAIPINALMPHQVASLCERHSARLIHISTDCVFSGAKGNYKESDTPDALDIYGKSKFLGEVDATHAVTIRTSIIGHELSTKYGLLEWFLDQEGQCPGFKNAIFSGLPTISLARLIRDTIIPNAELSGVFHVAAKPISKFDLLSLISSVYKKAIEIVPDDTVVVDRSLNADRFNSLTGYVAPEWRELIEQMHSFR